MLCLISPHTPTLYKGSELQLPQKRHVWVLQMMLSGQAIRSWSKARTWWQTEYSLRAKIWVDKFFLDVQKTILLLFIACLANDSAAYGGC